MEQNRLHELEEQCIQGCDPPCTAHCPAHVNIRQMLQQISEVDYPSALKTLRKVIPFPEIIARTCDQPCQEGCNREILGGAIRVADLELACCRYSQDVTQKPVLLPKKSGRVAVIGGGICGMTAAFELGRKGYHVTLYEAGENPGGRLWQYPAERLPHEVILREAALLGQVGVEIYSRQQVDLDSFPGNEYDIVFLASGGESQVWARFERTADGYLKVDPITYQTSQPGVFAGGGLIHPSSTIFSLSDGRRAAISMDRYLQQVSLTASRSKEGTYETRLFTSLAGIDPLKVVQPSEPAQGYSKEEAQAEAKRCLQCECMECVKVCEYLDQFGSYPGKYVRDIYNNLSIIMRQRTANKFINSCTLCGLCKKVCPTDLDMGEVILQTRQTMVQTKKMPISAHDFALRDMAFSNSERFALTLPPADSRRCEFLFFPGCQLAASNPEYIPLIYNDLAAQLPGLGVMLRCCGAPADWSGEEELFRQVGEGITRDWLALEKPKIVLACSSCNRMLKKLLPGVETIPLWQVLTADEQLKPAAEVVGRQYTIHDPCTSRYELDWQDSARMLLHRLGVDLTELTMSRELTACCGYGGVTWLANPEMVHSIIQRRINEGAGDYITYCVMCRDLFAGEGKPTLHLLDLLYGKNPDQLARRKAPDYSQRHENRMRIKQKMLKLIQGKDVEMMESFEKINLEISGEVRAKMESRLILVEDLQKVIEHAETSGECFLSQETGHFLAFFKPNLITYWVEYTKQGETYVVHDAYSHRMQVGGDTSI